MNLIPHFTVAESVFLGQEYRTRWGALDRRRMKAATAQFFPAKLAAGDRPRTAGARPEPGRAQAGADCPRADRRRSAAGGVRRTHRPLEAQEASLVSSAILRLRDQGIAILYISHYLNEIATLCDRGTVLRNGEVVGYPDRDLLQNTER